MRQVLLTEVPAAFSSLIITICLDLLFRLLLHQQSCREANLEVALALLALGNGGLIQERFHQVVVLLCQPLGQLVHNLLAGPQCVPVLFGLRHNRFAGVKVSVINRFQNHRPSLPSTVDHLGLDNLLRPAADGVHPLHPAHRVVCLQFLGDSLGLCHLPDDEAAPLSGLLIQVSQHCIKLPGQKQ